MTEHPIKILYISSRGDKGAGGENFLLSVVRHLDRQRFSPIVVLPWEGTLLKHLKEFDVETIVCESNIGWLKQSVPWYHLLAGIKERVHRLNIIIKDKKINLVHTNSNHRLEGALAARLAGIHHIYHAHIEFQYNMPIFSKFSLDKASYARLMGELSSSIVAVSQSVANNLSPPVPEKQIHVINNGIETEIFDEAVASVNGRLHNELGLSKDKLLITAVGRLHPDKGFDFYLEAASQVLKNSRDVHFLLVGGVENKEFEKSLRLQAKSLRLDGHLHFLGFREDVPQILAESDIFVLSSRREGHPYVLLEAMACGCSVVATRYSGAEETIVEGGTGYLVDFDDVAAMSSAILSLICDSENRKKMGTTARQHVSFNFEARKGIEKLMTVYDDVFLKPPALPGSPGIDLFLQASNEIGTLGLRVNALEERLKQVEHLSHLIKENPVTRGIRHIKNLWRNMR